MTSPHLANNPPHRKPLSVDRPITTAEQDVLERSRPAVLFAQQILALDYKGGFVVGVLGPWGSGKTSYINLARTEFSRAGAHVLDFNPWMFSGADRLADAFFTEVSSELKLLPQVGEAGKAFEEYGELLSGLGWIPFVGPFAERARLAMRLLGGGLKGFKRLQGGANELRTRVARALEKLAQPVVVVLDDIDRLTTPEIRQVFQLVRLTASFPNIVYVLAFDRLRVEKALSEDGVPGRAYLEKILQLGIDLPELPPEVLTRQITEALDAALSDIENTGGSDANVLPNIFFEVVRPLIGNLRDVNRYALAIRGTLTALGGQVALADVLGMEAIRIFLPDVFAQIPVSVEALTNVGVTVGGQGEQGRWKLVIDEIIGAAGRRASVATSAIKLLFPAARKFIDNYHFTSDARQGWLRAKRVAHPDILRLYLERVPSAGLKSHYAAEQAFSLLGDNDALTAYLRSLEPSQIEDVISALEVFEGEFRPEQVVSGVVALLNLLPDLPDRTRGLFDFSAALKVTRVTYRLLRSLGSPQAIEEAVRRILPQLTHLAAKWDVISEVGLRKSTGERMISEEASAALEAQWKEEVRKASIATLLGEPELLRVYLAARAGLAEEDRPLEVPKTREMTVLMLENARTEIRSQAMDSYTVKQQSKLMWDSLISVFGSETELMERIDDLLSSGVVIDPALRELVEKYRSGWRPPN
jgi:hypothetical protein